MKTVILLQIIIFIIVLNVYSRRRFIKTLEVLNKREYPLKDLLLPAGVLLVNTLKNEFNTAYDRSFYRQILQLKGDGEADFYLFIHWANKLAYLLLGFLLLGLYWLLAEKIDYILALFTFIVLSALFTAPDYELRKRVKNRNALIQLEFPSFLYKLVLLLNAGLTLTGAWEKALKGKNTDTPLYSELWRTLMEIKGGKSEIQAYENLAKKCKNPEIVKFVSVIIQNTKKGSYELASILRTQAEECWDRRKHTAKRLGEEASTKLLLPMMLMFVAILMIVAAPAILAMKNM